MIEAFKMELPADDKTERLKEKLRRARAEKKTINWNLFSFEKSQELLKHIKGNFSDLVREEREES